MAVDIAKVWADKVKFRTFGRLKKHQKLLDANLMSVNEFRTKWNMHFASNLHMDTCMCHGDFCPFVMVNNEKRFVQ